MVAVVVATRWWGRGVVGGGGDNREAAMRSRWQLCWQGLKVLVGGGGDDIMLWMVVAGRLLSLKNLVRAKKPADRFGKVGTQVCIKEQEANL